MRTFQGLRVLATGHLLLDYIIKFQLPVGLLLYNNYKCTYIICTLHVVVSTDNMILIVSLTLHVSESSKVLGL